MAEDLLSSCRHESCRVRVLFYSGAAYDDDKKRAIEAGANAYVTKPAIKGLLESVTELVSVAK